ncbi:hypothetical protein D9M68_959590 [compost metagenome]
MGRDADLVDDVAQALFHHRGARPRLARAQALRQPLRAAGHLQVGGLYPPATQDQQQRHAHVHREEQAREFEVEG